MYLYLSMCLRLFVFLSVFLFLSAFVLMVLYMRKDICLFLNLCPRALGGAHRWKSTLTGPSKVASVCCDGVADTLLDHCAKFRVFLHVSGAAGAFCGSCAAFQRCLHEPNKTSERV